MTQPRVTAYELPDVDPDDELGWCDLTAAYLRWQDGEGATTVEELREFHAMPQVPAGAVYDQDVVYGIGGAGARELELLLYSRQDPTERRPAFVIYHGGGFRGGTRLAHRRQAAELAARGFVAASASYRFSDEARFPGAVEDAKCAVRWVRANAERIGADPDRIVVAGGSAGGYLAAMVTLTPGRWEGGGGNDDISSEVAAATLFSPLTDARAPGSMPEIQPVLREFFDLDDPDAVRESSPITHVHPSSPPILTLVGEDDKAATPEPMLRDFHAALDAAGVTNELVIYPGRRHTFGICGPDFFDVLGRVVAWVHTHLGD